MVINLQNTSIKERQDFLNHAIGPRPIAFVSTVDKNGSVNLAPFSYFNLFSVNPPIVIFSSSRRVRDNTNKHTLENIQEVPEASINIVTNSMVQQVSLASCEYPKGTDEFIKAGFTQVKAVHIQPPLVKESPVQLECNVIEVKTLGNEAGAGNLVICEVLYMHISDSILNEEGTMIDQIKINHTAKLGGNWYTKTDETNIFTVTRPNTKLGIGFDNLPPSVLYSGVLSGNQLAQLANVELIPDRDDLFNNMAMIFILKQYKSNAEKMNTELHRLAARLLTNGLVKDAWQVLLRSPVFYYLNVTQEA